MYNTCGPEIEDEYRDEDMTLTELLTAQTQAINDLVKEFQKMVALQIVLIKYFQMVTEDEE